MENQYELYHIGVLGMKWGVRKKRQKVGDNSIGARRNGLTRQEAEKLLSTAPKKIPKEYQPTLTPAVVNKKAGYKDKNTNFYEGDIVSARKQAWQWDNLAIHYKFEEGVRNYKKTEYTQSLSSRMEDRIQRGMATVASILDRFEKERQ
jgi:hypothetical protein